MKVVMNHFAGKLLALLIAVGCAATAEATPVIAGPISDLGTSFLFNNASTGGGDTNAATTYTLDRALTLNVGPGGSLVTITGLGFAMPGSAAAPTVNDIVATITYLGANGVFGGGDDVVIGTDSNLDLTYGVAGTYRGILDSPFSATINGLGSMFRISLVAPSTMRFKTTIAGNTLVSNMKISIAGTSVAIPEPGAFLFGGLAALCVGFSSRLFRGTIRS